MLLLAGRLKRLLYQPFKRQRRSTVIIAVILPRAHLKGAPVKLVFFLLFSFSLQFFELQVLRPSKFDVQLL
jgi:hypothetical protein